MIEKIQDRKLFLRTNGQSQILISLLIVGIMQTSLIFQTDDSKIPILIEKEDSGTGSALCLASNAVASQTSLRWLEKHQFIIYFIPDGLTF